MSRFHTHEIETEVGFRHVDLEIVCAIEYSLDDGYPDYLEITKLLVWSDRRKQLVEASERLRSNFWGQRYEWLVGKVQDHNISMQEYYRDCRMSREEFGDRKFHEERDAA